jgi:hypothetical protein
VIAAQYGIYLSVLTLLWALSASGIHSGEANESPAEVVVLSFALLFIVDDWVLISEYYDLLKGRVKQRHWRRVDLLNLAIVPLAIYVSISHLSTLYSLLAIAIIVLATVMRYCYSLGWTSPDGPVLVAGNS